MFKHETSTEQLYLQQYFFRHKHQRIDGMISFRLQLFDVIVCDSINLSKKMHLILAIETPKKWFNLHPTKNHTNLKLCDELWTKFLFFFFVWNGCDRFGSSFTLCHFEIKNKISTFEKWKKILWCDVELFCLCNVVYLLFRSQR